MDIKRKIETLDTHIRSIAEHRDEDAALRKAALDQVIGKCEAAKVAIDAEVEAKVKALEE